MLRIPVMEPGTSERDREPLSGSLWTTPAPSPAALADVRVDQTVSAKQIRAAVDADQGRASAFSARVPDQVLRVTIK